MSETNRRIRGMAALLLAVAFGAPACHSAYQDWNPAERDEAAGPKAASGGDSAEPNAVAPDEEGSESSERKRLEPPPRPEGLPEEVGGDPVKVLLPLDAIPSIDDPEMVPASEAGNLFDDDEVMIGIYDGNEARAYSAWHLDHHEIVNDTLGDEPIAVTW